MIRRSGLDVGGEVREGGLVNVQLQWEHEVFTRVTELLDGRADTDGGTRTCDTGSLPLYVLFPKY